MSMGRRKAMAIIDGGVIFEATATFLGNTDNAVMTQVMVALCIYLILAFLKFQGRMVQSLQQISRLIHVNLFARRDLMALFKPPPNPTFISKQMRLL